MPSLCVVPYCSSRTTGHRFPTDTNRRKMWLVKIHRDKFKPTPYSRICKNHFLKSDYMMPLDPTSENRLVHNIFIFDGINLNRDTNPEKCSWESLKVIQKPRDDCLLKRPDVLKLVFSGGLAYEPLGQFTKKRCSLRLDIDECLEDSITALQPCVTSTQWEGIKVWRKIDNEIADYICKNNAEIASNLFEKIEAKCWDKGFTDILSKCTALIKVTTPVYDIKRIKEHCREFTEFKECVFNALPEHCPKNVTQLVTPIFTIVMNNLCS